jgi:hypothetical protein
MTSVVNPYDSNVWVVSADGLEPSTHALKEYPSTTQRVSTSMQEWQHHSMFMRSRSNAPLLLPPTAQCCYQLPMRSKHGRFVGNFVGQSAS